MTRWTAHNKDRYLRVSALPVEPERGERYWIDTTQADSNYTHYLFRYPARFHRPVVRWALAAHKTKAHPVLDPFAGSGTLNVEALVSGRTSVGIDLDPLACFIAQAKTALLDPDRLDKSLEIIKSRAARIARTESDIERLIGSDISPATFAREKRGVWVPQIPNIEHWFKRHVIIDLGRLLELLRDEVRLEKAERNFFLACCAAIIRRASNADPAPVSGLEVTAVQAKRNKTREINVVEDFLRKSRLAIHGMRELWSTARHRRPQATAHVLCGDARDIESAVVTATPDMLPFSHVVTSPPYCNAVEYPRRHKLEMYWLRLVSDMTSHVALSRNYIGHRSLGGKQPNRPREFGIPKLDRALKRINDASPVRAISLERYFASMQKFLYELARVTAKNADFICVIADSTCAGIRVPTSEIISELASEPFVLNRQFRYAIQNHHMQYGLRNGIGIREEHVLAFRRR